MTFSAATVAFIELEDKIFRTRSFSTVTCCLWQIILEIDRYEKLHCLILPIEDTVGLW